MIDLSKISTLEELVKKSKWLEGKTLAEVEKNITKEDSKSRVITKGKIGYGIESGFFGIKTNSEAAPDIKKLGVEIKTCPLKYNKKRDKLAVKEPLSLNIINYEKEYKNKTIKKSSIYKKNKKILFIFYIHEPKKQLSTYKIKYVFLWKMTSKVVKELEPDYKKIIEMIKQGKAHEIHQYQHCYLTLCPKHNGKFNDPTCKKSKRRQPFSNEPAEIRGFRLKNKYVNQIICKQLGKVLEKGGWEIT